MSEEPEQLKLILPEAAAKKGGNRADAALRSAKPLGKQPPSDNLSVKENQLPAPESQPSTPKSDTTAPKDQIAMQEPTKSADFETMLADLEKVVAQLEGELKLEEALTLFERGLQLSKDCEHFLKAAQQKIELLKRSASGSVHTEPFSEEAELSI